jgi:hypothetical protein
MTRPFDEFAELRSLLDALCEESINPEQLRRLEELVLGRPEAEAYYLQYMSLYAELGRHFSQPAGATEQSLRDRIGAGEPAGRQAARRTARAGRRARNLFWGGLGLAGLAAGLLLALVSWRGSHLLGPSGETAAERTDTTVAVLLRAPGARWEDTGLPTRAGAPLPPGRLRLKSGFAQIEFYSGATVILEGPADFQLISPLEAYCARGKLRATVPPQAQGFTISSPKLDLVDRGTEFGLQVDGGDRTEVHVFQGKVELYDAGSDRAVAPPKELTTGRALRLNGPDAVQPIESDPAAFRTARDLAARQLDETRRRQREWRSASEALRRDPSLVVYYPFQAENAESRTLLDQAGGRQQPHDGAIVGCNGSWATGRWPGKQGLEFRQVSDRVRFHVPGEFEALTLMAWVRVDALPNKFNSLMMTDSWNPAAPHWHISDEGKLELGVQGPNRKGGVHYYSPQVFTPDRLGQWTHLAVVYDLEDGLVTHYVDGKPVQEEPIKLETTLRLGDAEIGNWNVGTRRYRHVIRYFTGCIDEFMLFSRALSGSEVERMYEQGRPPS